MMASKPPKNSPWWACRNMPLLIRICDIQGRFDPSPSNTRLKRGTTYPIKNKTTPPPTTSNSKG
ncbi:hypothetical protein D3C76_1121080 [compost metagenome]